jgi:hypothetical protein
MEELRKTHKDVPFGWVLWLQEVMVRIRREPGHAAPGSRAPAKIAHG